MSRNKFNMEDLSSLIAVVLGIGGIGYGLAMHTKLAHVSERLDRSINELAYDTEIDIPEDLVNKAIEKAVESESKKAVEKATNAALIELKKQIHNEVCVAVDKEYETIKDSVLKEITDSASKINVAKVNAEVRKSAEKAVLEKLDDNMDDLLEKFNTNLENTSKIYYSIAQTMRPSNDNTIKLQMI